MSELITCRLLGNVMKKLIMQGNVSKTKSKLYIQYFYDDIDDEDEDDYFEAPPPKIPVSGVIFKNRKVVFKTGGKAMFMWQFGNAVMNLAYKHGFLLDNTEICSADGQHVKTVEGNSILNECVMII